MKGYDTGLPISYKNTMFNIENQGVNTFLTYSIKQDDVIDDLSLGMLTNNRIKGVAPIFYSQLNEDRFLKYNISSKAPAAKLFTGIITRNRLLSVVSEILSAIMAAEEYMVDASLLLLDLNHIYIDVSTYEVLVICLPVVNRANNVDLSQFFKNIIFSVQYDQTENCDYVPVIINYLNSTSVFSPLDFKKLVDGLKSSAKQAQAAPPVQPKPQYQPPQPIASNNRIESKGDKESRGYAPQSFTEKHDKAISNMPQSPVQKAPEKRKGLVIPGRPTETQPTQSESKSNERKMSLLYLVRHYTKENAEIYKSQKNNSSKNKSEVADNKSSVKSKNEKSGSVSKKGVGGEFMIPGQTPALTSTNEPSQRIETPASQANPRTQSNPAAGGMASMINKQTQTIPADFGDTTLLVAPGAMGETSLLTANVSTAVKPRPYLIRIKTGEKVLIDKPRFRIGKENSYVDYFIGDNTAISRSHADVIVKGDNYYLVDLNSTNHTFVNGSVLQSGEERQIKNGNRIRFANEEFDFVEEI